jgi:serine protease Do
VVVVRVTPGTAAADAGLRPADVILELNGQGVSSVNNFQGILQKMTPGSHARLLIKRAGHTIFITMEIPKK